jgi:hypothetical protein
MSSRAGRSSVLDCWSIPGEDDDCVDPAPEVVGVVAEADVDGVDVVALVVVVVGAAVVAVVGVAAVVEGLGGALATTSEFD